jgi:hypothetical protein
MKYYLDMKAEDRINYKRFKSTIEPGATTKSIIEVKPESVKISPDSGFTKFAKKMIRMLLLKDGKKTEEEVDILLEEYEKEILNG